MKRPIKVCVYLVSVLLFFLVSTNFVMAEAAPELKTIFETEDTI